MHRRNRSLIVVDVHSEHLPLVLALAWHEVVVGGKVVRPRWSPVVSPSSSVKGRVAHRMVASMGLVARMVLCWRPRQGMGVMPSSSTSSSTSTSSPSSVPLIRASLLLPARLHVSVCLKGVIVVIWRVVGRMSSGTVVLPLGLTQQLLLRTSQARRDRQREGKRGFQGKWGRDVYKVCALWKG